MHYYKRDHSPIAEGIAGTGKLLVPFQRSPYEANLAEYEGNIVTQSFKDNMLQQLGPTFICQTQRSAQTEKSADSVLSSGGRSKSDSKEAPSLPPEKKKKQKNEPSRITNFSYQVHRDNTRLNFFSQF